MTFVKGILEKLLSIQEKFYSELRPVYEAEKDAEGRASILEVIGPDGGSYKLQIQNGLVNWAADDVKPMHIIRINEDTFLRMLTKETTLDEAFDKKEATIMNYTDETINIVEIVKWKKYFNRLYYLMDKVLGGDKKI